MIRYLARHVRDTGSDPTVGSYHGWSTPQCDRSNDAPDQVSMRGARMSHHAIPLCVAETRLNGEVTVPTSLQAKLVEEGYAWLDDADGTALARQLGHVGTSIVLEPKQRASADPWSLSGRYGLSQFPWHTDGAISLDPPRWLLLQAVELSEPTWTEVLVPSSELVAGLRRTVLRAADRLGRVRYLPAAVRLSTGGWRMRWDPRACPPQIGLAAGEVESQPSSARVEWRIGRLLVLDNFHVLHRRPPVGGLLRRRLKRTYVWEA